MSSISMKATRLVSMLALLVSLVAASAQAEGLSAAAQEPYQKGLLAARQQNWKLALSRFGEAQKLDPEAPEIWFNLGLVSSKMPGFEIRAIALFKAYLLANPGAPNAAAVRKQIASLQGGFEKKAADILDRLEAILLLQKVQGSNIFTDSSGWYLASARYLLGDRSGAVRTLRATEGADWQEKWRGKWQESGNSVNSCEGYVAVAMVAAGLVDEGIAMVQQQFDQDLIGLALEQGDLVHARKLLNPATTDGWSTIACLAYYRSEHNLMYEALTNGKAEINALVASGSCQRDLWWSVGRIPYLLRLGTEGIAVNSSYKETQLVDYMNSYDLNEPHFGHTTSGLTSLAYGMERICREYRKLHGPASASDEGAEAYYLRGNVYFNKGAYDAAIRNYREAIRLNPDYAMAYHSIGDSYYNQEQYDQAIENYDRATHIDPNDAEGYYFLGNSYKNMGRYDLAVKSYKRAMLLDPDYAMPDDVSGSGL